MFIISRFLNEGAPAEGGPAPIEVSNVSDVFDKAADHFFGGDEDEDVGTEDDTGTVDGDEEPGTTDDDADTSDDAANPPGWTSETDKPKPEVEKFKPYVFNGKVFGEDQVQEFKTEEEMNKVIAKGLAAPRLHQAYKELKSQVEDMRARAEYSDNLQRMAKEDPKGLLDLIAEDLVDEDTLATWVHDKYSAFAELAKLTPEQRAEKARIREAERIIEERKLAKQEADRVAQERDKLKAEKERKDFELWRGSELTKWTQKIPAEHRESVNTAMKAVVAMAKAKLDNGQKVSFKEMSTDLERFLSPLVNSKSPTQLRREQGKAMEAKKNAATAALQGATKTGVPAKTPPAGPKTAGDVFDWAARRLASGHAKLRS